jgi:hypothetical protein
MATEKASFYVPKPDPKYSVLKNPIGVDVDTSKLSTRIVNPSTALQLATETAVASGATTTIQHLLGQQIDFDFSVSGSKNIDWDNSVVEFRDKFAYYKNADTAISKVNPELAVVPWNLTWTKFESVNLSLNNTTVFDKNTSEYTYTQTCRAIMEYSKEQLEACSAIYGPVGDEEYHAGIGSPTALAIATDQNSMLRNDNWLTDPYGQEVVKSVKFKDLFFSIPGLSQNLRNIKMSFKFKSKIPLAYVSSAFNLATDNCGVFPQSVRIILHEYAFAPSTASVGLSEKMANTLENIAYVDVETKKVPYSSDITISNQRNIQYLMVAQFCDEVDNNVASSSSYYRNPSQTMLLNGYSATTVSASTILKRSDKKNTTACCSPPSSIQAEIGGIVYPSNAITLANAGSNSLINHADLYNEYRKACGKQQPAIDENIFKRTMPFFCVKAMPNNKLIQSSDITIRLPWSPSTVTTGTSAAQLRVLWGRLRGYTIAASGVVSEAISSY